MTIRQDSLFDFDYSRQDEKNAVSFRTDASITIEDWRKGINVNSRKVGNEILFLCSQHAEVVREFRNRELI